MEKVSLLVMLVFAGMLAWFGARLIWSIGRNLASGLLLRRRLGQRLAGMPLAQALERSGADPTLYLHDRQLHDIERDMRRCEGCQATEECSTALDAGLPTEKFEFCPNYDALFKPGSKPAERSD
jgi:hypothetical protein